jgi:hypothetical protein
MQIAQGFLTFRKKIIKHVNHIGKICESNQMKNPVIGVSL